jgi:tetratricopeptide (TPR) repeat protein
MNTKNIRAGLGLAALFLAAVLCLERGTQARAQWRRLPPPLERPLPPRLNRYSLMAALGDHSRVAADWAYVECLQYIGDVANRNDNWFGKTEALYREVLWLDPGFHHAVREGGAVLGWNYRRLDAALAYLKDAARYDPSDDRARVYRAALAFHKLEDPAAELEALRAEVMRQDAPEMLLRIVGNIYLKEKDWDGALAYWTWIKTRAKEPMTLDMADASIKKALAGKTVKGKR